MKKYILACLGALIISTAQANLTNLNENSFDITRPGIPVPKYKLDRDKDIFTSTTELQYPILSGDGKTILLPFGPTEEEYNQQKFYSVYFGENFSQRFPLSMQTDPIQQQLALISADGSLLSDNSSIFQKQGNEWKKVIDIDTLVGKRVYSDAGITRSGLIYAFELIDDNSENTTYLLKFYDPKQNNALVSTRAEKLVHKAFRKEFNLNHDGSVFTGEIIRENEFILQVYYDNKVKELWFPAKGHDREETFLSAGGFWWHELANLAKPSPDGKTIIGYGSSYGIVYSGADYTIKTELPAKLNNKQYTAERVITLASTYDASIIGGAIDVNSTEKPLEIENMFNEKGRRYLRPVIWYGEKWANTLDLKTLGGKDTDFGLVTSMSYEGDIISGMTENEEGELELTLWRLSKEKPDDIAIVSPDKERQSAVKIAEDLFGVIQYQRNDLTSLLNGCSVEKGEKHYCVSLRSNLIGQGDALESKIGFSTAYQFSPQFSAGLVIDKTIYQNFHNSYQKSTRNNGLGLYAEWKKQIENQKFYIRPAVSFNRYHTNTKRQSETVVANGGINLKGFMMSLTLGQEFQIDKNKLGWFFGSRYARLHQNAYTEDIKGFPFSYDAVSYRDLSLFAGVDFNYALNDKLNWISSVEIEQAIYQRDPQFKAHNQHIGEINVTYTLPKTTLSVGSGVEYKLNDNFRLELMPRISKTNSSPLRWNVALNLTAQF